MYLLKEISTPALPMTGLSYLVFVFSFLIVRDLSLLRVLILYQINSPTTAFLNSVGGLLDFLPQGHAELTFDHRAAYSAPPNSSFSM